MRVSIEWLKDYIDIEMTPQELADALSMSGTAVDRVHTLGGGITGVVVADVLEVKPHPNADALMLAVVDDGETVREVVCGAPNVHAGMKSPFAREGSMLPAVSSKPLKKAKIRGVESAGMLLSAAELGISEDHTGILELAPDAAKGTDVHEILPLEDIVLELEITPNRPDCMSVVGIAREVSALTGAPLRLPPVELAESPPEADTLAKVVLDDPLGCPRYTARAVMGVEIGPSPAWMQRRLTAAGLRPISNVVDVTNYVLLELGQPLHAFDMDLLAERTIIVRRGARGEPMRTLDGVDRQLDEATLVIADPSGPVAIAGIIGGEGSEVTERSTNILIESAHFEPTSILLTSKRLGIRTEASARFERGVDPGGTAFAAARAARLMNELAGGQIAAGAIDAYPTRIAQREVEMRPSRANKVLGTELGAEAMAAILESLGAQVATGETLKVTVPTNRGDLEREIDLVEEVARINGFDRIPETVPRGGGLAAGLDPRQRMEKQMLFELVAQGLSQVVTYSFMNPADLDLLGIAIDDSRRAVVTLLNPLAETGECMRTTLLPGLLRVAGGNMNRGNKDLALFEAGRAFISQGESVLPVEIDTVGIILAGDFYPANWSREEAACDFFDLKGMVENLAEALGIEGLHFAPAAESFLAPGRGAVVSVGDEHAGYIGQLHPRVASAFDIEGDIYACELLAGPLLSAASGSLFSAVGRFPNVKVDIAVVVDEGVSAATVERCIRKNGSETLRSVRLFDLYRGPQVAEGAKSLAYALEFGSPEGTLTDEQAHRRLEAVIAALQKELGAAIRGREQEGEAR